VGEEGGLLALIAPAEVVDVEAFPFAAVVVAEALTGEALVTDGAAVVPVAALELLAAAEALVLVPFEPLELLVAPEEVVVLALLLLATAEVGLVEAAVPPVFCIMLDVPALTPLVEFVNCSPQPANAAHTQPMIKVERMIDPFVEAARSP
jgi:hypothetical protein